MSVLSSNRIAWQYHDDEGNIWRVAALKAWTDQAKLGGNASSGADPQRPGAVKMRRCVVSDGAGHSRMVPVYEPTAPIVTSGTVFGFNANVGGVITEVSGTSNGGFIREGSGPRRVTKQIA